MKHKYEKMIKAKADNVRLVLFVENQNTGEWWRSGLDFPANSDQNFFLCHPKHEDACLHWLNGGETQFCLSDRFFNMSGFNDNKWHPSHTFMDKDLKTRIKPKKEKRWIVVSKKDSISGVGIIQNFCIGVYKFKSDAVDIIKTLNDGDLKYQIIEIEIEIEVE